MHIVLIIFGLLLVLFGGGCTVILLVVLADSPAYAWSNLQDMLPYWIPLGLLPLVIGWLLFRWGLRTRRAKRAEKPGGFNHP